MSVRYHLAPLAEAAGVSLSSLGHRLGISGTQWKQARDLGVGEKAADRYAVRLGLHPFEVWPEMAEDNLPLCEACQEPFAAARSTQRFCSLPCRRRQAQRRWRVKKYAADPAFAEQIRAKRRAYYQECRAYELARQRRYDAEVRAKRKTAA